MPKKPWEKIKLPNFDKKDNCPLVVAQISNIPELKDDAPNGFKRAFFIILRDGDESHRGTHIDGKNIDLMMCVSGSATAILHSDVDGYCQEVELDDPTIGLIIRNRTWHDIVMKRKPGTCITILLVLCTEDHAPEDETFKLPCNCKPE